MSASPQAILPERPGKTSVWTASRRGSHFDYSDHGRMPSRAGDDARGATLDAVRADAWKAWRHLFPPHSLAAQTPNGNIVVSWSVQDDPSATSPYAAPIMIKLEDHLVDLMTTCDAAQRRSIARHHEQELRAGMRGYDPYAHQPSARVVVIG